MSQPDDVTAAVAEVPADEHLTPLVVWQIPTRQGATLEVAALPGRVTVFVGPNGSGKSSLAHWLSTNAGGATVKRVIAHRRVWLHSAGGDITFSQRDSTVNSIAIWDQSSDSRWLDHADSQRGSIALLDLTALENDRNARLARLLEERRSRDEIFASVEASPLVTLNGILRAAGLRVQLEVGRQVALKAQRLDSGREYPANQMSDGEKSSLLLAAEVLTAPTDSVIVIDEPERHLHRAISAELVAAVLASRPDCHFVLMTHDIDLAALTQRRGAQVLSVSNSEWKDLAVEAWTVHVLEDGIPEAARLAVLGGRAQALFVEGDEGSPDLPLYRLLFPEWNPISVGSCETVIRSVVGLNQSTTIHWVSARGVVDNDGRDADEIRALREKGVLVLPVSEIESLYYHPDVVEAIARRQAEFLGGSFEAMRNSALDSALAALRAAGVAERLARSASIKALSRRVVEAVPGQDVATAGDEVEIRVANPFADTLDRIRLALAGSDLAAVARVAPIRDCSALARIRESLKLPRKEDYEAAARTLIASDADLRKRIADVVGALP